MAKIFPEITDELRAWITRQKIFFVATAPLSAQGHVNCSPKGADTFRVLDARTVIYLDLTGSGAETIAHLRENKRIVVMFCAFEGEPRVLRFHGRGECVRKKDAEFPSLARHFRDNLAVRSIIKINVERVSTSCGYAVPLYDFRQQRETLETWAKRKGPLGLDIFRRDHNTVSIDGLPGL